MRRPRDATEIGSPALDTLRVLRPRHSCSCLGTCCARDLIALRPVQARSHQPVQPSQPLSGHRQ